MGSLTGLAACSPPAATGVLTVTAWPCAGPRHVHTALVEVFLGTRLVAHDDVPGGSTYRFVLSPGRYEITNTGRPGGTPNAAVVAGTVTRVDLPDLCR